MTEKYNDALLVVQGYWEQAKNTVMAWNQGQQTMQLHTESFNVARLKLTGWYVLLSWSLLGLFTWAAISAESRAFNQVIDLVHSHVRGVVFNVYLQQQIEEFEQNFARWLLLFDGVILLVSAAASYFLSGRTLAPIERTLREQQRFAADVSHELRTPLASMAMELEAFERGKNLSPEAKELSASLQEEIRRMSGLVDGLLRLVRSEVGGEKRTVRNPVDVAGLLRESVKSVRQRMETKKLTVEENIEQPGEALASRDELKQVMLVLLDNAAKYTPEGGRVRVAARRVGRLVEFTIFNSGQGLAEVDVSRVFDRFFRGKDARDEGSGLGLAIARTIVESFGGTIAVANQPGKGVTFRVQLPGVGT